MDFIDHISALASRVHKQLAHIQTEEATKNALVLPFINALGYNVFDPLEVVPEFIADVGIKKGEKVDYAIMLDGKPIMLFECKHCGADLDQVHASQLYRYFTVTDARIGVLTNGIIYRFYSDLEQPNRMDERPFLEFNVLDIQEPMVDELKKLTKSTFNLDDLLSAASDLKYTKLVKQYLTQQFTSPTEDFVKLLARQAYDGIITQSVKEQFVGIVRRACSQLVNERISDRLKSALREEQGGVAELTQDTMGQADSLELERVITTDEEMEAYRIVRAILRESVDVKRIAHRDVKTYFGVLLDDNNRKPICRLYFNTSQWYIGLFDEKREERRVPLTSLDEIYQHADRLKQAASMYEGRQFSA